MSRRTRKRRTARQALMIRPERAGWWAMVMLIGFLAVGSAALLFSYFHLLINSEQWPPEGTAVPDLTLAAGAAGAMVAAALALYIGVAGGARERRGVLKAGLAAGFLLAAGAMAALWVDLMRVPFTAQTNIYGSLFFALAGYSAVLMAAGLVMLASVQVWVWMGYFGPRENLALVNVGLYWAFVAASWLPAFAALYLVPNLMGGS